MLKSSDCVLAVTGASGGVPLLLLAGGLIVAALAVIAIALIHQRRHRSLATGIGALALAGALLIAPVLSAAPAQAASGQEDCAAQPAQPATPILPTPGDPESPKPPGPQPTITVTPEAPKLSDVACGTAPEVLIPTVAGVVYQRTSQGDQVTVTATPAGGYTFPNGAVTSWTFSIAAAPCACTPNAIDWEDQDTSNLWVSFARQADGQLHWSLTGVPAGWTQAGATSSFELTEHYFRQYRWGVGAGEERPSDLPMDWVPFESEDHGTGAGEHSDSGVAGSATIADNEANVTQQMEAVRETVQLQYPNVVIHGGPGTYIDTKVLKLTVTAPSDSCGNTETRSYTFRQLGTAT